MLLHLSPPPLRRQLHHSSAANSPSDPPPSAISISIATNTSSPNAISIASDHSNPISSASSAATAASSDASCFALQQKSSDDGSVASKLLLHLDDHNSSSYATAADYSCKEAARETPYQRRLKLKRMKLHQCAEEIGCESSSSDYTKAGAEEADEIDPIDEDSRQSDSAAAPPEMKMSSCKRSSSFPPPLATLAAAAAAAAATPDSCGGDGYDSSYSDSNLSLQLIAIREEGRLVLRQERAPWQRNYLKAHRADGRLTLCLLATGNTTTAADSEASEGLELATAESEASDVQQQQKKLRRRLPSDRADGITLTAGRRGFIGINRRNSDYRRNPSSSSVHTFFLANSQILRQNNYHHRRRPADDDDYQMLFATNHVELRTLIKLRSSISSSCAEHSHQVELGNARIGGGGDPLEAPEKRIEEDIMQLMEGGGDGRRRREAARWLLCERAEQESGGGGEIERRKGRRRKEAAAAAAEVAAAAEGMVIKLSERSLMKDGEKIQSQGPPLKFPNYSLMCGSRPMKFNTIRIHCVA